MLYYKLVETKEEEEIFYEIFSQRFEEMKYETTDEEGLAEEKISYLVKNANGEYAGTVQFNSYKPYAKGSTLVNPLEFLQFEGIEENLDYTIEVDKFSVLKGDKGSEVLPRVMQLVKEFAIRNNVKFFIAEMNPVLCRALKIEFGIGVIRGKIKKSEKGYSYVPTVIPIDHSGVSQFEQKQTVRGYV